MSYKLSKGWVILITVTLAFLCNLLGRVLSLFALWLNPDAPYLMSPTLSLMTLLLFIVGLSILGASLKAMGQTFKSFIPALLMGICLSLLGAFWLDMSWLYNQFLITQSNNFADAISAYLSQTSPYYLILMLMSLGALGLHFYVDKAILLSNFHQTGLILMGLSAPLLLVLPLPLLNVLLFSQNSHSVNFSELSLATEGVSNGCYVLLCGSGLLLGCFAQTGLQPKTAWLTRLARSIGMGAVMGINARLFLNVIPYYLIAKRTGQTGITLLSQLANHFFTSVAVVLPLFFVLVMALIVKQKIKKKPFEVNADVKETTGHFGTADLASEQELKTIGAYEATTGPLAGKDNKERSLYLPLVNKLTMSPPGGGKTVSSSIPLLLSYNGPLFVFDIKGELWAVTAKHRARTFKRKVVTLDPYNVLRGKDFRKGKPQSLLKKCRINPFDWVPEDKAARDRMLNAFAASFIVNEGGNAAHFDDNAKILIRGYIDYMMQALPKASRTLEMLFKLMSEPQEEATLTFEHMSQLQGRAAAASNQITRVGADERGSILSTSYRQIDWMSDSNLQDTLSESNVDLADFLKGKMDIFVILPEDQVAEHSRLVRMLMALLKMLIVQANPSDLPKQKMVFLLEELAQLGYCPDVEQFIEVLRGRRVVVWTVFQSLSQIKLFEKPDLFIGAPLKQIFTLDDVDTMQWIQTLGAKKTIQTKTVSANSGDSKQQLQWVGGTVSKGEGESVQETGRDLIHLNEIRELPKDEQFLFLHSFKPIRCKKVRYFEHADFVGQYDPNPLENWQV